MLLACGSPANAQESRIARGDTSSFWLSSEASSDSLDTYWKMLQQEWLDLVPDSINDFGLDEFQIDSLQAIGAIKLEEMVAGTLWRSQFDFWVPQDFNRAQGVVTRLGWSLQNVGLNRPKFQIRGGYAFGNQRPVMDAELELPLIRRRWNLSNDRGLGREYQLLALRLSGSKDVARFAGDDRRHTRTFTALVYGADPNHYYEERRIQGRLTAQLWRRADWWIEAGYSQHRSLERKADWNIFGHDLSPDGNRRADEMDVRRFATGADWEIGPLAVTGEVAWLRAGNSRFVDEVDAAAGRTRGHADFRRASVTAVIDQLDPLGNQWVLQGRHRCVDRPAPVQWRNWLGGYNAERGMLRGYDNAELSGEIAQQASLDLRFNFDPFRKLRVPVLKNMGWQPIVFADWGKTKNQSGSRPMTVDPVALLLGEGEQDWRADVGFGFGRRYDLPGFGLFNKMRLYAAKPVGNGQGDRDWQVLFAFEQ